MNPESASNALTTVASWVATNFGWYYVLTGAVVFVFIVSVALSRAGRLRLGPEDSRPQFNLFTWASMLFAAGIGVDLMFFAVAEPITQYYTPPSGAGETTEAAKAAVLWPIFHYGLIGWGMYALMGLALAFYAYRHQLPLSLRAALYPLFGKRIYGRAGDTVDIAATLGTTFGMATSLGIGVVQLNFGLSLILDVEEGLPAQVALIVLAIVVATVSTVSGVEKGIRRLSEINVVLVVLLALYVLFSGSTRFLLESAVTNLGGFTTDFVGMVFDTHSYEGSSQWMQDWTLFFWAWWIAVSPFVAVFLARISRGRTIREFIFGVLLIPFGFIFLFITLFGNSALSLVLNGNDEFGQLAVEQPEHAFYSLLQGYPLTTLVILVATLIGLLLYVTCADSGALSTSNFCSYPSEKYLDGPRWMRVFWAVAAGALTLAMLSVGGVAALQGATLIIGLPFSVVMYLMMVSLYKTLRAELREEADAPPEVPVSL